jgi:hypothetical protein
MLGAFLSHESYGLYHVFLQLLIHLFSQPDEILLNRKELLSFLRKPPEKLLFDFEAAIRKGSSTSSSGVRKYFSIDFEAKKCTR